jgi:hypothetical protein
LVKENKGTQIIKIKINQNRNSVNKNAAVNPFYWLKKQLKSQSFFLQSGAGDATIMATRKIDFNR